MCVSIYSNRLCSLSEPGSQWVALALLFRGGSAEQAPQTRSGGASQPTNRRWEDAERNIGNTRNTSFRKSVSGFAS